MRSRDQSSKISTAGFSLVEIMVVLVLIGLLSTIAVPTFQQVRDSANASAYASDLRTYSAAFELHATEKGSWPPDSNRGVIPLGMGEYLPNTWTQETRMGGHWDWEYQAFNIEAGISIAGANMPISVALRLDSIIDDGNLVTGQFVRNVDRYTYILQAD